MAKAKAKKTAKVRTKKPKRVETKVIKTKLVKAKILVKKPKKAVKPKKAALARTPFDAGGFNRIQPRPGRAVVLRPGDVISVIVERTDTTLVQFYCKVADTAANAEAALPDTGPATATTGITELKRLGGGQIFQSTDVPVAGVAATPAGTERYICIRPYFADGSGGGKITFAFTAVPQQATAVVSAKSCLFFNYLPDSTPASTFPHAGEKLPDNAPFRAAVPMDARTVVVSVPLKEMAPQKWTHSGGGSGVPKSVTAEGEKGDADNTAGGYKSSSLSSQNITTLNNEPGGVVHPDEERFEGLLAAMWDYGIDGTGVPRPTTMFPLGVGMENGDEQILSIPDAADPALNLCFGSHQESNWAGAANSLEVVVEWR